MKTHKLPKINLNIIVAVLFLILAYLSWLFYQIPALTLGDTTYVIFIFIPFLCVMMSGIFFLFHINEVAKQKEEAFKRTGKATITYYRTKTKKEKKKMDKRKTAAVSVVFILGMIAPVVIASGVVGFPLGVPDLFATYKNPTYMEAIIFITQDSTDQNQYILPTYKCTHFTEDFVTNARAAGWRAGYVRLNNPEGAGHAIAVFDTTDAGFLFVEPQTDRTFSLTIMLTMIKDGYYAIGGMNMPLDSYSIDWHNPLWT
jgi:hypothetical protein